MISCEGIPHAAAMRSSAVERGRQMVEDKVVREAERRELMLLENGVTLVVVRLLLIVDVTIHLDDEAMSVTVEVDYESGDDLLPANV